MENRILVRNEDCEKLVLGTILNYGNSYYPVAEYLSKECFYNAKHIDIYQAIKNIAERGDEIDLMTVSHELGRIGSFVTMYELTTGIMPNKSFSDITKYALILRDYAKQRACFPIASRLMELSQSEAVDVDETINRESDNLVSLMQDNTGDISTVTATIDELYTTINKNLSSDKPISGTPTGFERIDSMGGLQQCDLIIIAADTSMGKTSFAIKLTMEAINAGDGVAFYSMEMNRQQLVARMVAMESGVKSSRLLYDKLTDNEIGLIDKSVMKFQDAPLYFDDKSTSNIDNILCSIRRMVSKYNVKGIVIDYLQILSVNSKSGNVEQMMADAARKLKNIAKELNIWIIALSQLNRDNNNPVPTLARLRSSGQIGEAADTIILLYRAEYYDKNYPKPFINVSTRNTCMIDVAKGRNIGVFKFICGFIPELTKFYDLDGQSGPIEQQSKEDTPF